MSDIFRLRNGRSRAINAEIQLEKKERVELQQVILALQEKVVRA